jgi:cell division protein ZapA (FtsZ GTPase activity inhibitor)
MKHLGDFDAASVLYTKFTTYRPSTGAPFTLAGTPVVSVYKDGSLTQSTAGITLTVDFDGLTGLHHLAIDTSADGTFYSAGSHFEAVITTGTVDSVSVVGSCVASFSLRKDSALKATVAGRTLDVSAGGEAGLDWANIGSPTTAVNLSATNIDVDQVVASVSGAVGSVTGAVGSVTGNVGGNVNGSVATVNALAANSITAAAAAADFGTEVGTAVWATATRELTAGTNIVLAKGVGVTGFNDLDAAGVRGAVGLAAANLDTQIGTLATGANLATVAGYLDTEIAAILADTNELQTDWANGGRLDLILDARASQASVDTIDTNVDAILVDTAEIGAAGAGLTALASAANLATLTGYVDTEVAAIKATTDKLDATLELSSDGQIFTAAALQNAPSSGGGLDAAGVRAAVGLASANLDTQLAAIDTKTTNLPSDPADQSLIIAATTSIANLIGTPAGVSLAADVAAVQSDTNDLQSRLPAALISGRIDATVGAMQADVLTSTALAASAVTEIQTGLSTLDAAGVRSAVGLAAANLDTQLAAIDDAIDTEVGAIKATTDKLDPTLENSSDGWIFTAAALQQVPAVTVPTAADVADAVWDEPIASHAAVSGSTAEALNAAGASGDPWVTALPGAYTAGQAGYLLGTNLDATVSSRASAADLATVAGYVDTEVAAIKAVTDKLDATLELSSDGQIFTAAALQNAPSSSGLDAAGVRAAIGLASANLDTQLADLPTNAELSTALASSDDAVLAVLGTPAGASLAADVAAVQADTNDLQTRLPAALVSGRIDASVGAMAANVMTAAAAAADLTTELQAGLATAAALSTLDGKVDVIDGVVDAILVDTAEIGVAGAGLTALATAANLATVAGYLDTEIAAILADTNELQTDWTNGGRLDLLVDAIKAKTDALPASPAAVSDIPTAGAIADAVHDEVVEGTVTLRQSIRLHNSALGGKVAGLDTFNPVFRDLADSKDVIDATVDSYGNRSAVTRDLT